MTPHPATTHNPTTQPSTDQPDPHDDDAVWRAMELLEPTTRWSDLKASSAWARNIKRKPHPRGYRPDLPLLSHLTDAQRKRLLLTPTQDDRAYWAAHPVTVHIYGTPDTLHGSGARRAGKTFVDAVFQHADRLNLHIISGRPDNG